jgi:hypothetical protein
MAVKLYSALYSYVKGCFGVGGQFGAQVVDYAWLIHPTKEAGGSFCLGKKARMRMVSVDRDMLARNVVVGWISAA